MHVVLVTPEIPQNTGNIGRLTAATGVNLHLIKPLGFSLEDRYLKRAGLDYWSEVNLNVHETWDAFLEVNPNAESSLWLYSKKATTPYTDVKFSADDYLVFGSETKGLSDQLQERYAERRLRIPIDNPKVRSLNLSNSVSIAVYEARRQFGVL